MYERFTERARGVVTLAADEARTLGHNFVGTEHILLGLLREEEGLAARVLEHLGVSAEPVREEVIRVADNSEAIVEGQIPLTPRAKKVLELALREALGLGHNYIGTEHILLGLVRENEGVAALILRKFDADSEKIRNEVIRMLSGPGFRRRSRASSDDQPDLQTVLKQARVFIGTATDAVSGDTWRDRQSAAALALDQLALTCQIFAKYLRAR